MDREKQVKLIITEHKDFDDTIHFDYLCGNCYTEFKISIPVYCPECGYKVVRGEES